MRGLSTLRNNMLPIGNDKGEDNESQQRELPSKNAVIFLRFSAFASCSFSGTRRSIMMGWFSAQGAP